MVCQVFVWLSRKEYAWEQDMSDKLSGDLSGQVLDYPATAEIVRLAGGRGRTVGRRR
jgi:hypothetical protein